MIPEADLLQSVPTDMYIGGEWRPAHDEGRFEVADPATGTVLASVADATSRDGADALQAAVDAQPGWAATPARQRSDLLRRAFDDVMAQRDELALLITLEMGKPVEEARAEVSYGAEFLRWYSEEAVRINGRFSTSPTGDGRILTLKQPVGPCLLITPWNFPLAMGTRKIGPALAAGCTVVIKPAHQTPLSMLKFAEILGDCGLPAGVCNVVTTTAASEVMTPLIADNRARKLSFTGSTAVGRKLLSQAADGVMRVSMELGGNAPFVVFEDADVDHVLDGAVVAKMRNMGESCIAANRFLVHDSIADEFASKLADRFRGLRVGRGTQEGVHVGPMIDDQARSGMHELVEAARELGARALVGGDLPDGPGYFYRPTVLADVPRHASILREEVFGPIAPVLRFDDEDDAVTQANATEYGLIAYLYTRDVGRALRVTERLEAGMIGLNRGLVSNPAAPFGGVKQSGLGREGGPEGLEEYLETKYVAVNV